RQDERFQWNLLRNPNRLRIQTIDSLCAKIARSAPFLSQFGAEPQILTEPSTCYRLAVRNLLHQLGDNSDWQAPLARMLLHLDNDLATVEQLLINMLATRDQWLPHLVGQGDVDALRVQLERSLANAINDTIDHASMLASTELQNEIATLLCHAADNLFATDPDHPIVHAANSKLHFWRAASELLLVQTGDWRKAVTKANGFLAPSGASGEDKSTRQAMKQRIEALLADLREQENLRIVLEEIRFLPAQHYNESQWQIIADLLVILPILAAELQLVFRQERGVDFTEVALRARQALGTSDLPSDIALNWDYRLRHLLLDEFQDTSNAQYQLLELLTAGWQQGDGRTLFLVGDPMQSIYRFREAEVGLFLRAQQYGIGDIPLVPLQLKVNFRSQQGVIDWVNTSFATIFPEEDDIAIGAVSYAESTAFHAESDDNIAVHAVASDEQAQRMLEIIQGTDTNSTIAILVRARSQAASIIHLLQHNQIRYQAQDIERLAHRAAIQDCLALTRALLHPADRIAWLAILRAPWCGLTLADLHVLTQRAGDNTLWMALQNTTDLSDDGQQRLARIHVFLLHALNQRGRMPLRAWVTETWRALGGPECLASAADHSNVERFFELLERLNTEEQYDFDNLEQQLNQLFASVDPLADDRIQIMTMHKAKGLEFDVVILPTLERSPVADQTRLLLWWERPRLHSQPDLILAPIKAALQDYDPIYRYLRNQESRKSSYEAARLLYVSATRAKRKLHMIGTASTENKPASGSFLALLWPHVAHYFTPLVEDLSEVNVEIKVPSLRRVPINFQAEYPLPITVTPPAQLLPELQLDTHEQIIGTVIHQSLQRIAEQGLSHYNIEMLPIMRPLWRSQCLTLGLALNQLDDALDIIFGAIHNTLADERGRWLLSQHADHQAEY
ncbi:MAG: UvrD-helicase domain-containing protein, partial [Pseudomonadota bacterium]|nr:UvrD-helicase domain-containing protein [Pseudomonadota bacterium]